LQEVGNYQVLHRLRSVHQPPQEVIAVAQAIVGALGGVLEHMVLTLPSEQLTIHDFGDRLGLLLRRVHLCLNPRPQTRGPVRRSVDRQPQPTPERSCLHTGAPVTAWLATP
jgi:hypothetical protein